jgi:hypothetical protein
MIMYRSMIGVNNQATEIADEWIVHDFKAEAREERDADGRRWVVLQYDNT